MSVRPLNVKHRAVDAGPKRVTILGSTGSIGCSTLDILSREPNAYRVEALTAYRNVDLLAAQARDFKASLAVIGDESRFSDLKESLAGSGIKVAAGADALIEAACSNTDWVMAGIMGAAGLPPTLAALERGVTVALANKECLVCAGELMLSAARRHQATILPVDSEHNAIYQVFDFERPEGVEKIILTASGGPFLNLDVTAMARVTPAQAVAHPNWDMGAKISVDSATMMNKGLELIEAYYMFPVDSDQIEVLIHPQSVVHSLVAYRDGSVLAQLGAPDMRTPIAYALAWPKRLDVASTRLDLARVGRLTFEPPDPKRFPSLRLAREALEAGGMAPTILNAANEVAVQAFLTGRIGFLNIARTVEECLGHKAFASSSKSDTGKLENIFQMDARARRVAEGIVAEIRDDR